MQSQQIDLYPDLSGIKCYKISSNRLLVEFIEAMSNTTLFPEFGKIKIDLI